MKSNKTADVSQFYNSHKISEQGLTKFATLSPYLTEIQKRKKGRSGIRENRSKSKNQSSSKSFRIKQRSTSSLNNHSKKSLKSKAILQIINKVNQKRKQQSNSVKHEEDQKHKNYFPTNTLHIKNQRTTILSRNQTRDMSEMQKKKGQSFRRGKYESKSRNEATIPKDQNKQTIQVTKFGYTDTNRSKKQQALILSKNTEKMYGVGVKKFRRGKYQALYSSVTSNEISNKQKKNEPSKSQNNIQFTKKQSTFSLSKQNDLAEKDMQKYYRQLKSKQIQRGLQKSTEKYFKQQTAYRAPKTNTDIEIYISTMKNPSINRQSNASTLNTSEKQGSINVATIQHNKHKEHNILNYDFDFRQADQNSINGITEMSHPSEQDSIQFMQQSSFEMQRKKVQRQYFHKKTPQVDWSQQDCQIDDL